MGAVYRGRQPRLNRDVAIKLLPKIRHMDRRMNYARRFEQEAQAMARLNHPGIISVYDFGETSDGQFYFVMEFIDGMDIYQYLKQAGGKIPQNDAIAIVSHVLDALSYAHSNGIVHRDIKPANILLDRKGRIKIADFGLAKQFVEGEMTNLTLSNVAVGTPNFVAPEALEVGKTVDQRADVYAVGVMLYQLLTGKLPVAGYKFPSELEPTTDPRLDDIVSKALEPDPKNRYSSAQEVRNAINTVISQPISRVTKGAVGSAAKSKMPLFAGIGVAAVIVISLIAFFAMRSGELESKLGTLLVASSEKPSAPVDDKEAVTDNASAPASSSKEPEAPKQSTIAEKPTKESSAENAPAPLPEKPKTPETAKTPSVAEKPDKESDTGSPSVSSPEKPAKPEQTPTPPIAAAPTTPAPSAPASVPASTSEPKASSPSALPPDLAQRLEAYLTARRERLDTLAGQYMSGLDGKLNEAADAGNLPLVTAFREEKARVETLRSAFAKAPGDVAVAARETPALPALAEDAPASLTALRQVWEAEIRKIRADLDGKLSQTLQSLEGDLTRGRRFDEAQLVLTFRKSFQSINSLPVSPPSDLSQSKNQTASAVMSKSRDPDLARATKDQPFENSLGMKFVPVHGTKVLFCIHETRYKDYEEYSKRANIDGAWMNQSGDGFEIKRGGADYPVTRVSWDDAQEFCKWLSKKENYTYRLPTDEEWSYAVGIGEQEAHMDGSDPIRLSGKVLDHFPWGIEWPPPVGAGNYSDQSRKEKDPRADRGYIEGYDDGFPTTAPVMSFVPNEFGLYDLGGNVWEWCEDWISSEQKERVLRGGSWPNFERGLILSSYRTREIPSTRTTYSGFRVVVVSDASNSPNTAQISELIVSSNLITLPSTKAVNNPHHATKEQPFENSLGMRFVPVPGTNVLFSIHETRYNDYEAFAKREKVDDTWKNRPSSSFENKRDGGVHPVTKVDWNDAQKFCEWLSEKEGATYRLPTDEEWSHAVGIGDSESREGGATPEGLSGKIRDHFPWGKEWPPPARAGNYSDQSRKEKAPRPSIGYLESYDDGYPTTAQVMSFAPNEFGLYDLGGNVSEWCADWYNEKKESKVRRGGSWHNDTEISLRSSYRFLDPPSLRSDFTGFRIVLELAPSTP